MTTTADGVSSKLVQPAIYRGAVTPTSADVGDLWEDTSTDPPVLKQCTAAPNTFAAVSSGGSGTVTSVTATAPVTSSGGTAPDIALTTSGPNSVAIRDSNQNISVNSISEGYVNVAAAGTTTVLTAASAPNYVVTGSGGQTYQLPNATTLPNGVNFTFNNNQSSGAITVNNNSGTLIVSVPSGAFVDVSLLSNAIAAGSWDTHFQAPSNVSWSTNTFSYGGSITNATWNGNTIAINRGGTNGTATPTAGAIAYGTGTAYGFTGAGTSGQVLTSAGTGTPTWSTPTTGTVTSVATTGTVNGITLTGGPITSSGTITLGGTLDLSSPPAIGGTTAAAGTFTTLIGGGGSANYEQITGGATGKAVQFQSLGSDAAVSLAIQPKGTGAIDLAAGSSGVNISNGGTVTALTRSASGSSYTSLPSIAISAPTTAGGVQATATCTLGVSSATIGSGGTGYTLNDVITISGGTTGASATCTVSGVSGGVVSAVTFTGFGAYTVLPTNPAATTGGTGTGLTLNLGGTFVNTAFTITAAGSGYVEQPTVTFSGGGGSGAAAYASVGTTPLITGLGGGLRFANAGGVAFQIASAGTATVNYLSAQGSSAGSPVLLGAAGSDGNIALRVSSFGTSSVSLFTNNSGQEQLRALHTASAVNYVQVTGAATGGKPTISAQGSDAAVQLQINAKGGSSIAFSGNGTNTAFGIGHVSSATNYLNVSPSIAGSAPILAALGTDGNIDLALTPKGTGALVAQASDGGTTINARGANAVDLQTVRGTTAQVASGSQAVIIGGSYNTASGTNSISATGNGNSASGSYSAIFSGYQNTNSAQQAILGGGFQNTLSANGQWGFIGGGYLNTAAGFYNVIAGGFTNSGTSGTFVTQQNSTMNGTTAVTLATTNANIKVGQLITGTSIQTFPATYVAAISGTSLTLSQAASGSSTSTLSFYTPHGVVVGGGNNQATGAYSFIGGGGDAGTAANKNTASGDWSFVGGGWKNTASGAGSVVVGGGNNNGSPFANLASGVSSFIGAGVGNTASGANSFIGAGYSNFANADYSSIIGAVFGATRGIVGNQVSVACNNPMGTGSSGTQQTALLVLARQTTDATPTILTSTTASAGNFNQVILPNNSAYYFRGEVVAGVTGGGNTKGWTIEGVIKRGSGVGTTALVGSPTVTSLYADAGAATWTIAVTADTTNGGLAVTFTGQAATTIRCVAQIRTTEMTY